MKNKRNPRLVPYALLDERTKKSNKDSLREAVRTLLGYGYSLEAPDQDHGEFKLLSGISCKLSNLIVSTQELILYPGEAWSGLALSWKKIVTVT